MTRREGHGRAGIDACKITPTSHSTNESERIRFLCAFILVSPGKRKPDPESVALALSGPYLSCERFEEWAAKVGVECGPLGDEGKDDMIAELDAVVVHLYGLSERQLIHIFETFHEGQDYTLRLNAVLEHYRRWAGRR